MDNLSDSKKELKSPLKFDCPRCGFEVITNYLRIGEQFNCPHCSEVITVPETAVVTDEDSNVLYTQSQSKAIQYPTKEPTEDHLKKRFKYLYIINIFIIIILVFILPYIIEFRRIALSDFFWFYMLMFLMAISWAVPFYLSFAAINIWRAFIHRKFRILFATIGIFFIALSALSVYIFSELNRNPMD